MNQPKRSFLFLQGVSSPFFPRLADKLKNDGHDVHKIIFNSGDWLYWRQRKASSFRGTLPELNEFVKNILRQYGISDQILFGDRRPVHRDALINAENLGIRTHVFEEGYFRPYWVTLEREGVNGHSLLPRDPDWFREIGKRIPENSSPISFKTYFSIRALHDVQYHTAGIFNPLFFCHYRTHAPVNAAVEYAGYLKRFSMLKFWKPLDAKKIKQLLESKNRYFVLPLQLNGDAQIRFHSRFESMLEVIEFVMLSFAHYAPDNTLLVIKNHPLDMGLINYRKHISNLEHQYNLNGRTIFLESGRLDQLFKRALGTVTINSTAGGLAIDYNCPTIALSDPIYNLPGLTFQGDLDSFWSQGLKPEQSLYQCYRKTIMYTTQVNGGFYCRQGIKLAVNNACRVLEAIQSPLEKLF